MKKESVHKVRALFLCADPHMEIRSHDWPGGSGAGGLPAGKYVPSADDRGTDKGKLPGGFGMLGAEHELQGQTLSQKAGGNVGRDDVPEYIGIFTGVVESRQNHGMGEPFGMLVHICFDEVGHIVADTRMRRAS